jgi:predicted  nucleic acid-binding Zn-ribbon protein
MMCHKCGTLLTTSEQLHLRNRCLACYRRGIKFVLRKHAQESAEKDVWIAKAKVDMERMERTISVLEREWKSALAEKVHAEMVAKSA